MRSMEKKPIKTITIKRNFMTRIISIEVFENLYQMILKLKQYKIVALFVISEEHWQQK